MIRSRKLKEMDIVTPNLTRSIRKRQVINAAIFFSWLAIVIYSSARHDVWRDEMRALSLALQGTSITGMVAAVHGEGHPLLWYLMLRAGFLVYHTPLVLKLVSVAVAASAIILFVYKSPFSTSVKLFFTFGPLMIFEYSVMCRNYGISAMIMFFLAIAIGRDNKRPVIVGLLLLLLTNTNVHSVVLTAGYMAVLVGFWIADPSRRSLPDFLRQIVIPGTFALVGTIICLITVWPTTNDLVTASFVRPDVEKFVLEVLVTPGRLFQDVLPSQFFIAHGLPFSGIVGTIFLYFMISGLFFSRPLILAAGIGIFGLASTFSLIYPGSTRHEGLIIPYILSLYWIMLAKSDGQDINFSTRFSLKYVLPISLFLIICTQIQIIKDQFSRAYSMSGNIGRLISSSDQFGGDILISDFDYNLESIPYYTNNPTFLLRENRFGKVVVFTRKAKLDLSLAELLEAAQRLQADQGKPVMILLTTDIRESETESIAKSAYGWIFRYNGEQAISFRNATRKIASFRGALTENYDVYLLK